MKIDWSSSYQQKIPSLFVSKLLYSQYFLLPEVLRVPRFGMISIFNAVECCEVRVRHREEGRISDDLINASNELVKAKLRG